MKLIKIVSAVKEEIEMTKTEAKTKVRNIMQSVIGCAYYRLENENLTEKEKELIIEYINKLGKRACKSIGCDYVTY